MTAYTPIMQGAPPARWNDEQQSSFIRKSAAFNTPGIGTTGTVPFGTLPANAIVIQCVVKVNTAFNAGTTNVLTLGDASNDSSVFGAADVNEGIAATTVVATAIGYKPTSDTTLYMKYAQTGTAATTGAADIILEFIQDIPQT